MIEPADLREVARILSLVADPPNRRARPAHGDLQGDHDEWFDGGAIAHVTGYTDYDFADGSRATVHVLPRLLIDIKLAAGACVGVEQEDRPRTLLSKGPCRI